MSSPVSVVRQFVACVNAADVPGITALMTEDHRFIDATGNVRAGREPMTAGWIRYLEMFPDYHVEIESTVAEGDTVAAFGWAAGSFHGEKDKSWKFPSAFRAQLRDGRIAEWRVYADIEPMAQSAGLGRY